MLYEYICEKCEFNFEITQKLSDEPLLQCPECGESSLRKVLTIPHVFVKQGYSQITDAKLVSERNIKNLPRGEYDEMIKKYTPQEPQKMWYDQFAKTSNKKVAKMSPKQQQDYIVNGTVPNNI